MPHFLRQVEESQLSSLQGRLESISNLSVDFLILLSGSTLIATLGLFQNSPAVIIGAMIIAPLMRPLVALSLSTLTGDTRLLGRALFTLLIGSMAGVFISSSLALLFRSLELTPEILARTHPTLLDLGVAIFAGAVGAYCQADEKLSDTLAGVAISVALVPPLSVVGIGLAFGSLAVSSGAALLYATNLIGITVAGALVFLVMGFTPLHQAKKGLLISAVVSVFLIVPLALSMRELILENQISVNIKEILRERTVTFKGVQLYDVRVERFKKPMIVLATVLSRGEPITPRQVALVQDFLVRELSIPIEFRLQIIPATQITATGVSGAAGKLLELMPVQVAPETSTVSPSQTRATPNDNSAREMKSADRPTNVEKENPSTDEGHTGEVPDLRQAVPEPHE